METSKFQIVKKILLKPTVDNAPAPVFERNTEYPEHWYTADLFDRVGRPVSDTASITEIDMRYWTVTYKVGPTEKFEKVAAIVGEKKAAEVLDALGG